MLCCARPFQAYIILPMFCLASEKLQNKKGNKLDCIYHLSVVFIFALKFIIKSFISAHYQTKQYGEGTCMWSACLTFDIYVAMLDV